MSRQIPKLSPKKSYLSNLMTQHSTKSTKATIFIQDCISRIQSEIENGHVSISKQKSIHLQLKHMKKDRYQKQMQNINEELMKNEQMYKLTKKQLMKQKHVQTQEEKIMNEARKREVQEKIKKWTELQHELKARRELLQKRKREKEIEEEERARREEEERLEFHRLEKKKAIEQKLLKIQENRERREENIRQSSVETKHLNPKYIQIQNKFKQYEHQLKFEEEINKKNHKLSLKIDHEAIKNHEKAYIDKLQERKVLQKSSNSPSSAHENDKKDDFNTFFSKDEEKTRVEREKAKRRKDYQQKLKEIPVVIDEAKKVRVEIEIDKGKNKIKYNFLGQKALNDFQIYGQFQDFEINLDRKQIGNGYLKELPSINQNSRVQKSRSMSTLHEKEFCEKTKYVDYLKELRSQRSEKGNRTEQQIKVILRAHKQKDRAFSQLKEKGKRYDEQARRKCEEVQKTSSLRGVLRKSKQVDDIYLRSIKTKLACLQIKI